MNEDLTCEECGAKLTGEEGVMICDFCQEESAASNSLLDDCPMKELLGFFNERR